MNNKEPITHMYYTTDLFEKKYINKNRIFISLNDYSIEQNDD